MFFKIKNEKNKIQYFLHCLIIASVCWKQYLINHYDFSIDKDRIETINETVVVEEQEQQLLYFCNIPVQQVSGNISVSTSRAMFGVRDKISGSISTSEALPYWYLNEDGDGQYNSVSTNSSRIKFIKESEKPHVEVITYCNQTRTINHDNGEETIFTESEWKEYIFHLPQAIMQYPLQ